MTGTRTRSFDLGFVVWRSEFVLLLAIRRSIVTANGVPSFRNRLLVRHLSVRSYETHRQLDPPLAEPNVLRLCCTNVTSAQPIHSRDASCS